MVSLSHLSSRPATNSWTHCLPPLAIFLKVSGVGLSVVAALDFSYVLNEAYSVAFKLLIDGPQQR